MQERKSESIVTINSKFSAFNFKQLNWRDATVTVREGMFLTKDGTTGRGRFAVKTDLVAYINFLVSSAPSVLDSQQDNFDYTSPVQALEAGGLSGIESGGIEVGIPLDLWFQNGGLAAAPAVGLYVQVADPGDGGYTAADAGKPKAVIAPVAAEGVFGVITEIRGQQVMFHFVSLTCK